MCLENKLFPLCCFLGGISRLYFPPLQGHLRGSHEKGMLKHKNKGQSKRRNDCPDSLKATFILTSKPDPGVHIGTASPPIQLSVAKMARVAGCAAITTAFSQLRRNVINDNTFFFWHGTNVSKKNCNQIVNLAFPFPPRSVCPSFCF